MASKKAYWKSTEELKKDSPIMDSLRSNEFATPIPTTEFLGDDNTMEESATTRRDFLKYVGFSTAAATLAACEGPIIESVPYIVQPERIIPGIANYYATTIANGFDFRSVLVRTREGRPVRIENNDLLAQHGGGNARVLASVLDVYDNDRARGPMVNNKPATWDELDAAVAAKISNLGGKQLAILTQTFASPSTAKLINEFKAKYPSAVHVTYDAVSEDHALNAYEAKYGTRALPDYDLENADVIVGVGADFLGDWQGGGFDAGYARGRVPRKGKMSRHVQFEANMTLSGANADKRVGATPTQQKHILAALYSKVVGGANPGKLDARLQNAVDKCASQLKRAGSRGVLLCGIPDTGAQTLAMAINERLGSQAVNTDQPRFVRQGNVQALNKLMADMKAGRVGALFVAGVNPVYSLPNGDEFGTALSKVETRVAFASKVDETSRLCNYMATTPHYLESWGDVMIRQGEVSMQQPTIRPLFDTRQFQDTLLKWSGNTTEYKDYLRTATTSMGGSWNDAIRDGYYMTGARMASTNDTGVTGVVSNNAALRDLASAKAQSGLELTLYTKTALGDGRQANNPWLQELPDPITRASWDNYATMSARDAESLGIENWNVATGALNGNFITIAGLDQPVPVIIQPGQAPGSIGIALGYGGNGAGKEEMQVGVNAYKLYKDFSCVQNVNVTADGGTHEFACIQLQNTMMGRDIIRETTLETYNKADQHEWNPVPEVSLNHIETPVTSPKVDLWKEFDRSVGHHFNLSIDLNACTGCGACVVACHAENNVPVVGKREIRRSRDMHWLRIDRYYSSEETFVEDKEKKEGFDGLFGDNGSLGGFGELEVPSVESPEVAFMPVMCQHCNHAPCETVCPVAASAHGRQGQNHMTYNRCVGTRYCANNCPYKVRRFNWFLYPGNDEFDFHMNNDLGRMVINPDVTVRSRGVMEKCSMCIQLTQRTILDAKLEDRAVRPGEFYTACSSACDKGALTFGDINEESNQITELTKSDRAYRLLEAVGTKPNVLYQVQVRNKKEA